METSKLCWNEFSEWRAKLKPSFVVGVLLAGDRITCCDEVVGVLDEGEIRGVATIAPQGEDRSGYPTIVAVYVMPQYRRCGFGVALLEAAIRRCLERGFKKIYIEALSNGMIRTISHLTPELSEKLDVRDLRGFMDVMAEEE